MDDKKLQYIEEVALYFEKIGLQRMAGRVIGWLLVCDPPQQSMQEITDGLQAAKSSISTALRTLVGLYLVEQIGVPGDRRDYYYLSDDAWNRSFRARMHQVTELSELASRGLSAMQDDPPAVKARLTLMRDMNEFMAREFPKLLDRWEKERRARGENSS